MRISQIHPRALLVAEGDQRRSELELVAELLAGYRDKLLEGGFSEDENFSLVMELVARASWNSDDSTWKALLTDPESEEDPGDDDDE